MPLLEVPSDVDNDNDDEDDDGDLVEWMDAPSSPPHDGSI